MKITFKGIRIFIFLVILVASANYTYRQYVESREWDIPLTIKIYPINADRSAQVTRYLQRLAVDSFKPIEEFFDQQGQIYNINAMPPVQVELGSQIKSLPPARPRTNNVFAIMLWSLKLRYWAYQQTPSEEETSHSEVRMYVLYYDLRYNVALPHSSGLQKGLLGVVHAFAANTQRQQNNVIIAHEFLHTVGATDKYDPKTDNPLIPKGLANPFQKPLFPQHKAELMAGRVALSPSHSVIPDKLAECVVGKDTAIEIGWYTP